MSRLLTHIRHNVIGYLALFVALGGTSYAAFTLPKNSVGAKQLRNGAVTNGKLANGSVGAKKLDGKSIAGYIAFWAEVNADGTVKDSSPGASVHMFPGHGLYSVTWNRAIPRRCFAVATIVGVGGDPESATVALGNGPAANPKADNAEVSTFSGGASTPAPFNLAVICG